MYKTFLIIPCIIRYNIGMRLKITVLEEVERLAYENQSLDEESEDSIIDLLEEARNDEEARNLKWLHSFNCTALTGETYIHRMDEGLKILGELRAKMIKALVLFQKAYARRLIEPEQIYEYRNYLYEGIARFEYSNVKDLCDEEEDIHKIMWGIDATIDDLKELIKEDKEEALAISELL